MRGQWLTSAGRVLGVRRKTRPGFFLEPRFYPEQAPEILGTENLDKIGRVIVEYLSMV